MTTPRTPRCSAAFESLEIKDGKIILKPRLRAKSAEQPTEEHAPKSVPSSSEAPTSARGGTRAPESRTQNQ